MLVLRTFLTIILSSSLLLIRVNSFNLGHEINVVRRAFICPAARFVAPCECQAYGPWAQLICQHIPELKFAQQVLYSHFLQITVPWLKIVESPLPVLPSEAFLGAKIRRLEITRTGLNSIEDDAFVGLEVSLEVLIIQQNLLKEIPTVSLSKLKSLYTLSLSGNHISKVANESFFGLDKLKYLILSFNQISTVEPTAFVNLVQLSLSFNRLSSLQGAFRYMPKVKWLFLTGNGLKSFKGELVYLPNLKILLVAQNDVETLGNDLDALTGLEEINISANKIKSIDGSFDNAPLLESLNLSNNQISDIESATFTRLTNLRSLILSNNRLTSIHGIFKHLTSLRSLNLSGNLLSLILPGDLDVLENLMEADLSNNVITKLDKHSFKGLGRTLTTLMLQKNSLGSMDRALHHLAVLRDVNLEHNNLTTLNIQDFPCSCKSQLTYLRLKGNPLECSDHLTNVLDDLSDIKSLSVRGLPECLFEKLKEEQDKTEERQKQVEALAAMIDRKQMDEPENQNVKSDDDDGDKMVKGSVESKDGSGQTTKQTINTNDKIEKGFEKEEVIKEVDEEQDDPNPQSTETNQRLTKKE